MDAVVLWVDSSDPEYIKRRDIALGKKTTTDSAGYRVGKRSSLRYCLRGLYHNLSWLRTIYLVTDSQWPSWLDEEKCRQMTPSIIRVDLRTINPDKKSMYGSVAIEVCLHLIPSISDYFLYGNDDTFIVKSMKKSDWIGSDSKALHRVVYDDYSKYRHSNIFWKKWSIEYQYELARKYYGDFKFWVWSHQINVISKKSIDIVQERYPELFKKTYNMKGRQDSEHLSYMLFSYTAKKENLINIIPSTNSLYLENTDYSVCKVAEDIIFLCTNNVHDICDSSDYIKFMQKLLPTKLPSEKD